MDIWGVLGLILICEFISVLRIYFFGGRSLKEAIVFGLVIATVGIIYLIIDLGWG